MKIKSSIIKLYSRFAVPRLYKRLEKADALQEKTFKYLIKNARNTEYGKKHNFSHISSYEDFRKKVPVVSYEDLKPFVEKAFQGVPDVLWKGIPEYFAKTSGTTSGTKYIPVSKEATKYFVKGAWEALILYVYQSGNASFFDGKMIFLSGSPKLQKNEAGIPVGRLSGISQHLVPGFLQKNRLPSYETNCIEDWETKIDKIIEETSREDLRLISGIPPWIQMFFERLKEKTGKLPVELWKNLSVYVHGGVDFSPYEKILQPYFQNKVDYIETFPASEGFFGIQANPKKQGLFLMPDYGIFYEFIELEKFGTPQAQRIPISEVKKDVPYAMIISTNAGLWAYNLGDVIKFLSINPPIVKVVGRVAHFLSAFGEHVIEEEVNKTLIKAARSSNAVFSDFTVAPKISEKVGNHQWFIEFEQLPEAPEKFKKILDETLQELNAYYKDLRQGNILNPPEVFVLKNNATKEYMKSIGKLGGQNKFPHLKNDSSIAEFFFKENKIEKQL